jgi:hypothetical protein
LLSELEDVLTKPSKNGHIQWKLLIFEGL